MANKYTLNRQIQQESDCPNWMDQLLLMYENVHNIYQMLTWLNPTEHGVPNLDHEMSIAVVHTDKEWWYLYRHGWVIRQVEDAIDGDTIYRVIEEVKRG